MSEVPLYSDTASVGVHLADVLVLLRHFNKRVRSALIQTSGTLVLDSFASRVLSHRQNLACSSPESGLSSLFCQHAWGFGLWVAGCWLLVSTGV